MDSNIYQSDYEDGEITDDSVIDLVVDDSDLNKKNEPYKYNNNDDDDDGDDDDEEDNINIIINSDNTKLNAIAKESDETMKANSLDEIEFMVQSELIRLMQNNVPEKDMRYIAINYQDQLILVPYEYKLSQMAQSVIWPNNNKVYEQQDVSFLDKYNNYIENLLKVSKNLYSELDKNFETLTYCDKKTPIDSTVGMFSAIFKRTALTIDDSKKTVYVFRKFALLIIQNGKIIDYALHGNKSSIAGCVREHKPIRIFFKSSGCDQLNTFLKYKHQPFYECFKGLLQPLNVSLLNDNYDTSAFCPNSTQFCALCSALRVYRRSIMRINTPYNDANNIQVIKISKELNNNNNNNTTTTTNTTNNISISVDTSTNTIATNSTTTTTATDKPNNNTQKNSISSSSSVRKRITAPSKSQKSIYSDDSDSDSMSNQRYKRRKQITYNDLASSDSERNIRNRRIVKSKVVVVEKPYIRVRRPKTPSPPPPSPPPPQLTTIRSQLRRMQYDDRSNNHSNNYYRRREPAYTFNYNNPFRQDDDLNNINNSIKFGKYNQNKHMDLLRHRLQLHQRRPYSYNGGYEYDDDDDEDDEEVNINYIRKRYNIPIRRTTSNDIQRRISHRYQQSNNMKYELNRHHGHYRRRY